MTSRGSTAEKPAADVLEFTKTIQHWCKVGKLKKAAHLFSSMKQRGIRPTVVTYNVLMDGYSRISDPQNVHRLFNEMLDAGIHPRNKEFTTAIRACASNLDLKKALELFDSMDEHDALERDTWTYNAVLHVCAVAGHLSYAKRYFSKMKSDGVRVDVVTYTSLIDAYSEATDSSNGMRHISECLQLLEEMEQQGIRPNVCVINALMRVCTRSMLISRALDLISRMEKKRLRPTVVTFDILLDGLTKDSTIPQDRAASLLNWILSEMYRRRLRLDRMMYCTILNLCCRLQDLNQAESFFKELKEVGLKPNMVCYTTMMKCYRLLGNPSNKDEYLRPCFQLLEEMEESEMPFDVELHSSLINACANAGDTDRAIQLWKKILNRGTAEADLPYSAMIKTFLKAGDVQRALGYLDQMESVGIVRNVAICHMFLRYFCLKDKRQEALKFLAEMRTLKIEANDTIRKEVERLSIQTTV